MNLVSRFYRSWNIDLEALDHPHKLGGYKGFEWGSHTHAAGTSYPTVYVLTDTYPLNIKNYGTTITSSPTLYDSDKDAWNSGARKPMKKLRASFNPEPEWLDDATWYDGKASDDIMRISTGEVKDDLRLLSTKRY